MGSFQTNPVSSSESSKTATMASVYENFEDHLVNLVMPRSSTTFGPTMHYTGNSELVVKLGSIT